mgnify:CR=1 FL=1
MVKILTFFFVGCVLICPVFSKNLDIVFQKPFFEQPSLYKFQIFGFDSQQYFTAYHSNGALSYQFSVDDYLNDFDSIVFDRLFLMTTDRKLHVFDVLTQQQYFVLDNHVVKDYIVSSSYILLLTDLGHIICYDFYMGSLLWEIDSHTYDSISFFGNNGSILAVKGRSLDIIDLFSSERIKTVLFEDQIDHVLTSSNDYALIKSTQFYRLNYDDFSLVLCERVNFDIIYRWYHQVYGIGFQEDTNSFFSYDFVRDRFDWFYHSKYKIELMLFDDRHLFFIDEKNSVHLVSLNTGVVVFRADYLNNISPERFYFKENQLFVVTREQLLCFNNQLLETFNKK